METERSEETLKRQNGKSEKTISYRLETYYISKFGGKCQKGKHKLDKKKLKKKRLQVLESTDNFKKNLDITQGLGQEPP